MNLDDKICYCYHVSLRKLVNFARREKLQRASQMSLCLGAGTGCGWCIPILKRIHDEAQKDRAALESACTSSLTTTPDEYADARKNYLKQDSKNTFSEGPATTTQ